MRTRTRPDLISGKPPDLTARRRANRVAGSWKLIAALLPVLSLSACEVVIDADFPDYTRQLAVYSFVSPGQPIYVAVFETQDIRSSASSLWDTIEGASVTVWQGGELRITADLEDSTNEFGEPPYYRADWNETIRLDIPLTFKIEASGYPDVQSTVEIPVQASFTFQSATSVSNTAEFGDPNGETVTARFSLADQAGTDTYYLLIRKRDDESFQGYYDPGFTISDAPFRETLFDDSEEYFSQFFFSDATFRDGVVNFSVKYRTTDLAQDSFLLYSVNKSYYEYERTRRLQGETVDNPFAEPSPIYSNIDGGQGVVGTTSIGTIVDVTVGSAAK